MHYSNGKEAPRAGTEEPGGWGDGAGPRQLFKGLLIFL